MKRTTKQPEAPAITGEVLSPTHKIQPGRINLHDINAIRLEASRVYREARLRIIDSSEATKLVYILSQIGKMYELEVIEGRIAALERSDRR